jgi:hypothetical protein
MAKLVEIWRHPIKSHGREFLENVKLTKGQTMPWDRAWAVAHENSNVDGRNWVPCQNFSRGAKAPMLAAISATWDENAHKMTLKHPELPDFVFNPDNAEDQKRFLKWESPLIPDDRAQSRHLVSATERGMTDTDYASISIGNFSSHRTIEQKFGRKLSHHRWRCNLWLEGLAPWEEFDWVGKEISIGSVTFEVRERVQRCLATTSNPDTGKRDADILGTLETWGHRDFTVYAVPKNDGIISIHDPLIGQ